MISRYILLCSNATMEESADKQLMGLIIDKKLCLKKKLQNHVNKLNTNSPTEANKNYLTLQNPDA